MSIKSLSYKLSQKAFDGIKANSNSTSGISIETRGGKKSKSLVMIIEQPPAPPQLLYTVPIVQDKELFINALPEPATLFMNQAEQFSKATLSLLIQFPENKMSTLSAGDGSPMYIVDSELYSTYLSYKIASLTSLIMFLECFLNGVLPENLELEDSRGSMVGKKEVERNWSIKDKLKVVIPKIVEIDNLQKYQTAYGRVLVTNSLRNEFIHMKTKRNEKNLDPFITHFEALINLDLDNCITEFKNLVKLIEPEYFN